MENHEIEPDNEQKEKFGVLDYRIEKNYYVVDVRWKDGSETAQHIPVNGFRVVNPIDHKDLGTIDGKKALEILQQHAGDYTRQEFSWQDFV